MKAFLFTTNKMLEAEIREKHLIYYCKKKNKIPRNKLNHGGERPVPRKKQNTEERN